MSDESTAPPPKPAAPELNPAQCANELKTRFPALFGGAPKPVKLRIHADIQQRAPGVFTRQALSAFFRRYTMSTPYLIALTKATHRFDLDGQPSGELSEEHRQAAVEELARRRAIHEQRRAEEEEQRRNRAHLLRDFERTTLTIANFCALKGIAPEELEGVLAVARQEREERPRPAQRPPQRPGGDRPPPGQRAERGDRPPRGPQKPGGNKPPRGPRPNRGERPPRRERQGEGDK